MMRALKDMWILTLTSALLVTCAASLTMCTSQAQWADLRDTCTFTGNYQETCRDVVGVVEAACRQAEAVPAAYWSRLAEACDHAGEHQQQCNELLAALQNGCNQ